MGATGETQPGGGRREGAEEAVMEALRERIAELTSTLRTLAVRAEDVMRLASFRGHASIKKDCTVPICVAIREAQAVLDFPEPEARQPEGARPPEPGEAARLREQNVRLRKNCLELVGVIEEHRSLVMQARAERDALAAKAIPATTRHGEDSYDRLAEDYARLHEEHARLRALVEAPTGPSGAPTGVELREVLDALVKNVRMLAPNSLLVGADFAELCWCREKGRDRLRFNDSDFHDIACFGTHRAIIRATPERSEAPG